MAYMSDAQANFVSRPSTHQNTSIAVACERVKTNLIIKSVKPVFPFSLT